ncbi:MAG: TylF/MycF family methyltransferase, partial [Bacteroidales bacterium]|nr:TylF/MycF family methyltransferase [Bacteroidales bacterium]
MKVSALIFKKIAKLLAIRHIYLAKSLSLKDKRLELPPNLDYIRDSSLCLCAEEIMARNVGGNVAELGVYRGNFAKRINSLFPNKKIYLFDTFAGFTENAKKIENELMGVEIHQDFSQTSVDLVKQKMRYPENCIFEIGEFPESAKDCNDTFCFVSIDADLFE